MITDEDIESVIAAYRDLMAKNAIELRRQGEHQRAVRLGGELGHSRRGRRDGLLRRATRAAHDDTLG